MSRASQALGRCKFGSKCRHRHEEGATLSWEDRRPGECRREYEYRTTYLQASDESNEEYQDRVNEYCHQIRVNEGLSEEHSSEESEEEDDFHSIVRRREESAPVALTRDLRAPASVTRCCSLSELPRV